MNNNSADLKISQTLSNNRIKRRDVVVSGGSLLAASALMGGALLPATSRPAKAQATAATSSAVPADLIGDIATSAYIYAYPLIFMEMTRRIGTNVADTRQFARAPMNRFANVPAFPDATFTDVTRANVDTLYSLMWFDVSQEPLLISVPDSGGRFYLLQMCDMWTDVFDSPGKRTTGTSAQVLAIAGPDWQGQLPAEATLIHSPTAIGWIIGRTQTNGKVDYDAQPMEQAVPATGRQDQSRLGHRNTAHHAGGKAWSGCVLLALRRTHRAQPAACERLSDPSPDAAHRNRAGQALRVRQGIAGDSARPDRRRACSAEHHQGKACESRRRQRGMAYQSQLALTARII